MSDEKPVVAGTRPVVKEFEAGTYWWCACGRASDQPFCDGSHAGTSFGPQKFELEETKRVALCTCKLTATPPFCDGAHRVLPKD